MTASPPHLNARPSPSRATTLRSLIFTLVASVLAATSVGASPLVVCLGDSLTEGYGVAPDRSYPARLEQLLRERGWPSIEVVNAGISGSTSASGRSRLRWQLRRRPDLIVLALGANDGLRGVELESTKANLAATIDLAKVNDIDVLLAGMKLPPNYGAEYTEQFEALYAELAKQKDVALIPFLLEGVAARASLNLADGIHPNARGYEIVAATVAQHLVPLLPRASAANAESNPS